MSEEMVMRSVYLRPSEDGGLRRLAFDHHVTKSDLIRSAISAKLKEWMNDPTQKAILRDLELGRRTPVAQAGATAAEVAAAPKKTTAPKKAAAKPEKAKPAKKAGSAGQGAKHAPTAVPKGGSVAVRGRTDRKSAVAEPRELALAGE